jgi:hypothetical protein
MRPLLNTNCRNKSFAVQCSYDDKDFLRTNILADYLSQYSTDINCITYIEDVEDEGIHILHTCIIIGILIYMFWDNSNQAS